MPAILEHSQDKARNEAGSKGASARLSPNDLYATLHRSGTPTSVVVAYVPSARAGKYWRARLKPQRLTLPGPMDASAMPGEKLRKGRTGLYYPIPLLVITDTYTARATGFNAGRPLLAIVDEMFRPHLPLAVADRIPKPGKDPPKISVPAQYFAHAFPPRRINPRDLLGAYGPERMGVMGNLIDRFPGGVVPAQIHVVAGPGTELRPVTDHIEEPLPRIIVSRTQDPQRVEQTAIRADHPSLLQAHRWELREAAGGQHRNLLYNPTESETPRNRTLLVVDGQERMGGIDLTVRDMVTPGISGFRLSLTVKPFSGDDRYWYNLRSDGRLIKLELLTTPTVDVKIRELEPRQRESIMYEAMAEAWRKTSLWPLWDQYKDVSGTKWTDRQLKVYAANIMSDTLVVSHEVNEESSWPLMPPPRPVRGRRSEELTFLGLSERIPDRSSPLTTTWAEKLGMSEEALQLVVDVAVGIVPYAGDALDFAEIITALKTGRTLAGDRMDGMGWLFLGFGAVLGGAGAMTKVAGAFREMWRGQKFLRKTEEIAKSIESVTDPADVKRLRQRFDMFLRDPDAPIDLAAEDIGLLRRILAGLTESRAARVTSPHLTFDSMLASGRFKSPWIEALFTSRNPDGLARKAWLRQLSTSGDPELNRLAELLRETMGEELWRVETITADTFYRAGFVYHDAVRAYRNAIKALPADVTNTLGIGWDYDRFPIDPSAVRDFPDAMAEVFRWERGLPTDMPVLYGPRGKAKQWRVPYYSNASMQSQIQHRCWANTWHNSLKLVQRLQEALPGSAAQALDIRFRGASFAVLHSEATLRPVREITEQFAAFETAERAGEAALRQFFQPLDNLRWPEIWPDEIVDMEDLPEWYLKYMVMRSRRMELDRNVVTGGVALKTYANNVRRAGKPSPYIIDHERLPQRALRLVRSALGARGNTRLEDKLSLMFGSASPRNLRIKDPFENAFTDGFVRGWGCNSYLTQLGDTTYIRWLAELEEHVLFELIDDIDKATRERPALKALKWLVNFEIEARGLPHRLYKSVEKPHRLRDIELGAFDFSDPSL